MFCIISKEFLGSGQRSKSLDQDQTDYNLFLSVRSHQGAFNLNLTTTQEQKILWPHIALEVCVSTIQDGQGTANIVKALKNPSAKPSFYSGM